MAPLAEPVVTVATSSALRAESIQAAAWIMDGIKQGVPIWKRERYEDGSES